MAPSPSPTYRLTSAVASGDPEAITRFYDAYFGLILTEARRISGRDEHFCLDVVQETMLRVLRTTRAVYEEGQVVAWLKRIVRSVVYDELRRELRARRLIAGVGSQARRDGIVGQPVELEVPGPDQQQELEQRLVWIERELREMQPGTAQLLAMRYQLGWTLQRIGAALGLSAGAVDGRMRRAQQRMRRKYEEQSDG